MRYILRILPLVGVMWSLNAQTAKDGMASPDWYDYLKYEKNKISNADSLDAFWEKLYQVKKKQQGVVRIVHLGDSHIQADWETMPIRNLLRKQFGDAGRGLVFPFSMAGSNGSKSYDAEGDTNWVSYRCTGKTESLFGIMGMSLSTSYGGSVMRFWSKEPFSKMRLFSRSHGMQWIVADSSGSVCFEIPSANDSGYSDLFFKVPVNKIFMTLMPDSVKLGAMDFYAMDLKNDSAGIIYDNIGVNGAQLKAFMKSPLFFQHLRVVNPDLLVVSFGVNEAQGRDFRVVDFHEDISDMMRILKKNLPATKVIFTTPAFFYLREKYKNLRLLGARKAIQRFTKAYKIPEWDFYIVSGTDTSSTQWKRDGLLTRDTIHFTKKGYRLIGQLFFDAFNKGYTDYVARRRE